AILEGMRREPRAPERGRHCASPSQIVEIECFKSLKCLLLPRTSLNSLVLNRNSGTRGTNVYLKKLDQAREKTGQKKSLVNCVAYSEFRMRPTIWQFGEGSAASSQRPLFLTEQGLCMAMSSWPSWSLTIPALNSFASANIPYAGCSL